ncbi:Eukaryotic aspartyl protease family protein [Clavispora lusitaniae]|uniref:Peptidase A1 domain-containing protein n=1 Tax=Clavispora lusitaniae (strain ATCC 42720) TaxID=306902 RepID=C4YBL4_CLAL4|nr:uncharacterized protein CLUG_05592 [Clavispora lusitaniae ATCC 42720]EEQ41464.1 predicted protein [Clavispora lusitaniae ATCC 42720]KAF7581053.1 Eukaryotic aspartyl protease family protein [Clavispora lusitaniae]
MWKRFFLSVAAVAAQWVNPTSRQSDSSLESSDEIYQGKVETGMSFGSPPQPINASLNMDYSFICLSPSIGFKNGSYYDMPDNVTEEATFFPFEDDPVLGQERIEIGGFELEDFSATVDPFGGDPIVGLGLSSLIEVTSPLDSLVNSGYIKSRSFSYGITSGQQDVLFGAIDHGRYQEPLRKFKMFNYLSTGLNGIGPTILLDGMAANNFSISSQTVVTLNGDTIFQPDYYVALLEHFNATFDIKQLFIQTPLISCSYMNSTEYFSIYFSGEEYRIPEKNFISYFTDSQGNVTGCKLSGELARIDQSPSLSFSIFFNDSYMIVDYDTEEIGFAPLASESRSQNIEVISTGVPSATPAQYFNYTTAWEYSQRILGSTVEFIYTSAHPTYPMYTGRRLKESATESFNTASTHTIKQTATTSPSFESISSEKPSSSKANNNDTKPSSSSKGLAEKQTLPGSLTLFFASCIGALMMI